MKKIVKGLLVIGISSVLCGCGENGNISIICEGKDSSLEGIKQTVQSNYYFSKDQYLTNYERTTIQEFEKKDVYKIYKDSMEETVKKNKEKTITYDLKTNDNKKKITFTYKVEISREELDKQENKDFYKAINVLERAESNSKCKIKGINRKDLKK